MATAFASGNGFAQIRHFDEEHVAVDPDIKEAIRAKVQIAANEIIHEAEQKLRARIVQILAQDGLA